MMLSVIPHQLQNLGRQVISLAQACEEAGRYPPNSIQQRIALGWVEWVRYMVAVQDGLESCEHTLAQLERTHVWQCCEAHRKLAGDRATLAHKLHWMDDILPPHNQGDPLTHWWWGALGHPYNPKRALFVNEVRIVEDRH